MQTRGIICSSDINLQRPDLQLYTEKLVFYFEWHILLSISLLGDAEDIPATVPWHQRDGSRWAGPRSSWCRGRAAGSKAEPGVEEHQESPGHDSSSSHQQKSPSWIETITHVLFHAPRLMTLSKWIIFLNNKRIIMPIIMPEHSLVGFFKRCIMWSSLYLKHK